MRPAGRRDGRAPRKTKACTRAVALAVAQCSLLGASAGQSVPLVSINVGSNATVMDAAGKVFVADRYFVAGEAVTDPTPAANGTRDPSDASSSAGHGFALFEPLFQSGRIGSSVSYRLPLPVNAFGEMVLACSVSGRSNGTTKISAPTTDAADTVSLRINGVALPAVTLTGGFQVTSATIRLLRQEGTESSLSIQNGSGDEVAVPKFTGDININVSFSSADRTKLVALQITKGDLDPPRPGGAQKARDTGFSHEQSSETQGWGTEYLSVYIATLAVAVLLWRPKAGLLSGSFAALRSRPASLDDSAWLEPEQEHAPVTTKSGSSKSSPKKNKKADRKQAEMKRGQKDGGAKKTAQASDRTAPTKQVSAKPTTAATSVRPNEQLVAMGFDARMAQAALTKCGGDLTAAVEVLTSKGQNSASGAPDDKIKKSGGSPTKRRSPPAKAVQKAPAKAVQKAGPHAKTRAKFWAEYSPTGSRDSLVEIVLTDSGALGVRFSCDAKMVSAGSPMVVSAIKDGNPAIAASELSLGMNLAAIITTDGGCKIEGMCFNTVLQLLVETERPLSILFATGKAAAKKAGSKSKASASAATKDVVNTVASPPLSSKKKGLLSPKVAPLSLEGSARSNAASQGGPQQQKPQPRKAAEPPAGKSSSTKLENRSAANGAQEVGKLQGAQKGQRAAANGQPSVKGVKNDSSSREKDLEKTVASLQEKLANLKKMANHVAVATSRDAEAIVAISAILKEAGGELPTSNLLRQFTQSNSDLKAVLGDSPHTWFTDQTDFEISGVDKNVSPTAAIPMDNPYCSFKLTRVRSQGQSLVKLSGHRPLTPPRSIELPSKESPEAKGDRARARRPSKTSDEASTGPELSVHSAAHTESENGSVQAFFDEAVSLEATTVHDQECAETAETAETAEAARVSLSPDAASFCFLHSPGGQYSAGHRQGSGSSLSPPSFLAGGQVPGPVPLPLTALPPPPGHQRLPAAYWGTVNDVFQEGHRPVALPPPMVPFAGQMLAMVVTPAGCEQLKRVVLSGFPGVVTGMLIELQAELTTVCTDACGCVLIETIVSCCTVAERLVIWTAVSRHGPDFCHVATDRNGARTILALLQHMTTVNEMMMLQQGMGGSVGILARQATGSTVLIACLEVAGCPAGSTQFIYDEMAVSIVTCGCHKEGAMTLGCALSRAGQHELETIAAAVAEHTLRLSTDPFGNFLVQQILEYRLRTKDICKAICRNLVSLATHKFASRVAERCIDLADESDMAEALRQVVQDGVLERLSDDAFGNYVVQQVLQLHSLWIIPTAAVS